jgi:hypothetical protein
VEKFSGYAKKGTRSTPLLGAVLEITFSLF